MKFNIGMLFALVATNRLAAAVPVPQWNGKNAEAAYKSCTVAGAAAYAICRNLDQHTGANIAASGAIIASGAEAAVKISQSPAGQAAGKAIADGAKAAGDKITAGASAVKCAAGKMCDVAGKAIGDAASAVGQAGSKLLHSATGGGQRTNDVAVRATHHRRLAIRELEPEFEDLQAREPFLSGLETRDEAAPVYTRYAEPEPEPSWDNLS